jgi:hypothetical protein
LAHSGRALAIGGAQCTENAADTDDTVPCRCDIPLIRDRSTLLVPGGGYFMIQGVIGYGDLSRKRASIYRDVRQLELDHD